MTHESPNSLDETAATIAKQLGDMDPIPQEQVRRIVERLGAEAALTILRETLEIEAQGGMLLPDRSRRRTPGAVFFYFVRSRTSKKDRAFIWPPAPPYPRASRAKEPVASPLAWEDRLAVLEEVLKQKGIATTVKITLIGRPDKVVEKGDSVIIGMQSTKVPALPKGLPTPPSTSTNYVIFIARKQWAKVGDAIQNPDDALIIDGFPAIDPQAKSIAVFATNVTTKLLQAAKRQVGSDWTVARALPQEGKGNEH
jgi:PHAX RNA-binding domain-containing protein